VKGGPRILSQRASAVHAGGDDTSYLLAGGSGIISRRFSATIYLK
jgi:hypothetical protein